MLASVASTALRVPTPKPLVVYMCAMAGLRRGPKTSGTHRDSASSLTFVY